MIINKIFFSLILCLSISSYAQKSNKEVLFTINDNPYYTDEFIRVYNKNLDLVKDESQKELTQYLDLFIGYKLKICKAYQLGLQNSSNYKSELSSYRSQLSKNYLTDSRVTKELIDEAYKRSLKEIKASHILITLNEDASPNDTLVAYNKIIEIRNKAIKGEDFGILAAQYSQDPSAKENNGDLGYFSAFRMVYPFESAAYETAKGQISKPFRTRFGYHILKVVDIRDNRGEVLVEHIMILDPKDAGAAANEKAKLTIDDIYKKILQGENFEDLAKQFSEDKSSSSKGGQLARFSSGQLSSEEFETMAFSLSKENPISKPFKTEYGWHIIKLIEKYPVKTIEEMKPELEMKVSKDDRSRLIANSLNEKLRKEFPIKRNEKLYALISKSVTNEFYENKWEIPLNQKDFSSEIFVIKNKKVSGLDFLNYLKTQEKGTHNTKPISSLVEELYQKFVDVQLNIYYDENLENEFTEFANIMDEYRDGLLLFDLMDKEIWEKSKTDTIGLQAFYEAQKSNYKWKTRIDASIYSSTNIEIIKKAQKMLKQNLTADQIKQKLNQGAKIEIMAKTGVFEEDNEALPKYLKVESGVSEIIKDGEYFYVVKIDKILPAGYKTIEECKGKLINDYQQYLEQKWVSDLSKEFTVKVNNEVFERVKLQIQK